MALLALENLSFAYAGAAAPALDEISVEVERGEYLCICGKSGCGKTTLLRQLKTILTPSGERAGAVLLDGTPLDEVPLATQARRIGFVMQDPDAQIVTDKVWHELAFGLESIGCDERVLRLRVAEMASYFGIEEWFHRETSELSGGQKQLLNLASIMAMQPDVLILDEPTSQLDPIATADFLNTVRQINLELGTTVIITEHRLEDIFAHADRVLVLDTGHVTAHGTPREVSHTLYAKDDPMSLALPSPVRVFYGVKGALQSDIEVPKACAEAQKPIRLGRISSAPMEYAEHQTPGTRDDARQSELRNEWRGAAEPRDDECRRWDAPGEFRSDWFGVAEPQSEDCLSQARPSSDTDHSPICPLTVREGRTWLVERVLADPPARVAIADEEDDWSARENAVEIRDAWARYERDAPDVLRGLDLNVPSGSLFAIVGGNGSGKSTLLKCLCGVQRAYRGKLRVLGRSVKDWRGSERFRGNVAMMPQDPANLFSKDSVRDELAEMLESTGLSAAEREERIACVARDCGIEALLDAHPLDISGGEQQRAALAKVLLTKPRLLLLDEPTKGIDAFFKRQLAALLRSLVERGVTVIMVSHDVEFCARHADLVALLFDGGIVTTASPRRFFSDSSFYTTAANRMSRAVFAGAIIDEDVIELCLS